jgi:predicted nucleic acid-binding protein
VILADTSVWIDHFRHGDAQLTDLLVRSEVLMHPFVVGELALAGLTAGTERLLGELPRAAVATHDEVMHAIGSRGLARRGIGYVDAHLLAAVLLTGGARLWTRDARLHTVADDLELSVR